MSSFNYQVVVGRTYIAGPARALGEQSTPPDAQAERRLLIVDLVKLAAIHVVQF